MPSSDYGAFRYGGDGAGRYRNDQLKSEEVSDEGWRSALQEEIRILQSLIAALERKIEK